MSRVPGSTLAPDRPANPDYPCDLQEGRYWGIRAVLERIDGRLVREEYYTRLANLAVVESTKISIP